MPEYGVFVEDFQNFNIRKISDFIQSFELEFFEENLPVDI